MEIPYPLSTSSDCGDPGYPLSCDPSSGRLYLDALNGSSYLVLAIHPSSQRLVVQPPPWLPGATCTTRDMPRSEGLWLNQSLPFNITTSNTVFLFNCSPRLLVSPLNCSAASLCHRHPAGSAPDQCASGPAGPCCCTFVPGGTPSAYRIRLHSSGCRAFRSVLRLDPAEPPSRWEEGLEIQWAAPREPACRAQHDCGRDSTCAAAAGYGAAVGRRCLCNRGYYWDAALAACSMRPSDLLPTRRSGSRVVLKSVAGGLVGSLTIFAMASMVARYGCCGLRRRRSKLAKEREDELKAHNGGRPVRIFRRRELRKATSGFAKDRLLGIGGYGEVYKGVLEDGTTVAVKLARVGSLRSTQQVLNEVGILSVVSHKNLVRLLGCCVEANQPMMVYEYIPNGTLHQHLHNNNNNNSPLDWKARLKIAQQTADAIAYLHSSTQTPIYHRDIKSTNILLDMELNAKVSDFGLSRLAEPGLSHVSTCAQGTLGYLDPVYYRNYQLTDKSDVYSFGVVLLELLTSELVVDFSRDPDDVNLAVYATRRAESGAIMEVADRRLLGAGASRGVVRSAEQFSELAVACLREERPSMKEVAEALKYIIEMLD